jgi:hypothetical protein
MIYPDSDHDLVRVLLTVDKASSNVGAGVWKLNISLLQVQEVREQIASFWEHWKDRKSDFGNVAEWWDYGKLRVKSLLLKYSHKESRKRKQELATVLGRVWTSDSKVSRNTGIACAWREGSENITIC